MCWDFICYTNWTNLSLSSAIVLCGYYCYCYCYVLPFSYTSSASPCWLVGRVSYPPPNHPVDYQCIRFCVVAEEYPSEIYPFEGRRYFEQQIINSNNYYGWTVPVRIKEPKEHTEICVCFCWVFLGIQSCDCENRAIAFFSNSGFFVLVLNHYLICVALLGNPNKEMTRIKIWIDRLTD